MRVSKGATVGFCQGPCCLLVKTAESTEDRTHDSGVCDDSDQAVFGLAEEIAYLGRHSCFEYLEGFAICGLRSAFSESLRRLQSCAHEPHRPGPSRARLRVTQQSP